MVVFVHCFSRTSQWLARVGGIVVSAQIIIKICWTSFLRMGGVIVSLMLGWSLSCLLNVQLHKNVVLPVRRHKRFRIAINQLSRIVIHPGLPFFGFGFLLNYCTYKEYGKTTVLVL